MKERLARVVVALDAAAENAAAIETAARLAAHWLVPLQGVFVEDAELIDLAALPFAAEFTHSGRSKLTRRQVEASLHVFAERERRAFEAAASQYRVAHSFAVVRGPIGALSLGERDFVVAGAATRPVGRHFRVRSQWWAKVAKSNHPLLLARRKWQSGGSVVTILHERNRQAEQVLEAAAEIASLFKAAVTVFGGIDPAAAKRFQDWVKSMLAGHSLDLATEAVPGEAIALRRRAVELDCRLVAVGGDAVRATDLEALVEHAACDLLVIGDASAEPGR